MLSSFQIVFLIISYLIAAIPFGLFLTKIFTGKDVRQFGSGNIGATNVTRVAGKKIGLVTLLLDGLKGAIMVIIARYAFVDSSNLDEFLALVSAIAVIGHIFPIYLKFKGGKGVATTVATLLALNHILGLIVISTWLVVFAIFRISALSSITSITAAVIFSYFALLPNSQITLCAFLFVIILIRHKDNILRLIKGEEKKI